jgi:hypothetical protein
LHAITVPHQGPTMPRNAAPDQFLSTKMPERRTGSMNLQNYAKLLLPLGTARGPNGLLLFYQEENIPTFCG